MTSKQIMLMIIVSATVVSIFTLIFHKFRPAQTIGNFMPNSANEDYYVIMLFYSTVFGRNVSEIGNEWMGKYLGTHICNNKRIFVTDDTSSLQHATALLYHARDVSNLKLNSQIKNNYINILWTHESPANERILRIPELMSQYNLLMSYHKNADIRYPWIYNNTVYNYVVNKSFYGDINFETKMNDTLIAWIGGNCDAHNGREKYLKQLFKSIKTDSFGKCLHTNDSIFIKRDFESMRHTISKYKFYIAVENSVCDDYITDKFRYAVSSSSIPIVFSYNNFPNYLQYVPPHSIINIADFKSVKELAKYLTLIGSNKALYEEYFQYRINGMLSYKSLQSKGSLVSDNNLMCRIAEVVYNYKIKGRNKTLNISNLFKPCLKRQVMTDYL